MHHPPLHQFVRYLGVGAINTAVTLVVFRLLDVAGVPFVLASGIGYVCGGLVSYAGNRAWTFSGHEGAHRDVGPRFAAIFGLGLLTDLVLISVLVSDAGVAKLLAQVLIAPVIAVQGFGLARYWAFRAPTTDTA